MNMVKRRVLLAVAAVGGFVVLAGEANARELVEQPFQGVKHITRIDDAVRPLFINIVEIDLNSSGIGFKLSPRDAGGPIVNGVQDETRTQTTRQYADEVGAQVAINASYYRLENAGASLWTNNNNLAVSNGDKYSPFDVANNYALNISQNKIASIIKSTAAGFSSFTPSTTLYNAVSGNVDVLRNGVVTTRARSTDPGNNNYLHPRTAVGVSSTGRKLWLVTVDGRQTGFSEGMYHDELGTLFKGLGAYNAINLDGGGSTTMTFDYYDRTATSNPRSVLINSGTGERYNGTSLGVFAAKNPNYVPPAPLPSGVKLLDDFEKGSEGRFTSAWNSSGTTDGITSASLFEWTGQQSKRGFGSQEINLVYGNDGTNNLTLRHLSGGGNPGNNQQLGKSGYVGFMLKLVTPGLATGAFQASILIDDINTGETTARMEKSVPINIIADGKWHLYQWNLGDATKWDSFVGGNGVIDRSSITIDSILLNAPTFRGNAQFFLDSVAYNTSGTLVTLVPEPSLAGAGILLLAGLARYRRNSAN